MTLYEQIDPQAKIQVRRARTMTKAVSRLERNKTRPYNWVVRQPVGGGTRVFAYKDARLARLNADMLARTGRIGNWGLRGFHIEYDYETIDEAAEVVADKRLELFTHNDTDRR